jgi:hypothetical protein
MVEVQVRVDDDVDILGFQVQLLEFTREGARVIDTINLVEFCVEFISDAGLDQNVVAARLDQQASQANADSIAGIGRDSFLPHRLGNYREHLSAIEMETSVGNSVKIECAKFHGSSINSMSTPAVLEG